MNNGRAPEGQVKLPGLVAFLVIFLVCFVNVSVTQINNLNIAILQMAVVLASFSFLKGHVRRLEKFPAMILVVSASVVLSNALALMDGIGSADWKRVFQFVMHMVFGAALCCLFLADHRSLGKVAATIMFAVLVYLCVLIGQWNQLDNPYQWDWVENIPLFRNIRHLAYFLCAAVVVSAWAVFFYLGHKRAVSLFVFLMAVSMLLWSGSRGAFLAGCCGIAMLALYYSPRDYAMVWRHLGIAILGGFMLSALFPVEDPSLGWLSAVIRTELSDSISEMSSGRLDIWKMLMGPISERPWFGWGGEGFMAVRGALPFVQAHNVLFQLVIEWGFIGAALILGAIAAILFGGMRRLLLDPRSEENAFLAFGISLTTAMLSLSLVDGVFYHGTPMTFLMIGLALVGAEVIRRRVAGDGCTHG